MNRFSIRNKIIFSSIVIIVFAFIMLVIGFLQFNQSQKFADEILPLSKKISAFADLKVSLDSVEKNLDAHFLVGGEFYRPKIDQDFENIASTLESFRTLLPHFLEAEKNKIRDVIVSLKKSIDIVLDSPSSVLSNRQKNELTIKIYEEFQTINELHSALSEELLETLQSDVETQQYNIEQSRLQFYILGLFILIVSIVIGTVLSFSVLRPILKLKEATSELSKGNYKVEIDIDTHNEIGELSSDFQEMALAVQRNITELNKLNAELEHRVEDRVIELNHANQQLQQEIDERKIAEEALRNSEERHRTTLEVLADTVITVDEQGIIQSSNPASHKLFGFTAEEINQKNIDTLVTRAFSKGTKGVFRTIS